MRCIQRENIQQEKKMQETIAKHRKHKQVETKMLILKSLRNQIVTANQICFHNFIAQKQLIRNTNCIPKRNAKQQNKAHTMTRIQCEHAARNHNKHPKS